MPSSGRLRPAPPPRGVLRASRSRTANEHLRTLPSPALAAYVAHFWSVRWSLPEPGLAETLPHPTIHVVFEQSGRGELVEVAGVPPGRFSRKLEGDGCVFGVKFRPAMFRPLLASSVTALTGKVLPAAQILGAELADVARAVFRTADFGQRCSLLEEFMSQKVEVLKPSIVEVAASVRDLVERLQSDQTLLRVEDVAHLLGVDQRTLQRRFREYVGVTPKWVVQRYRLHEAAERLRTGRASSLASLASELGYADQAHFTRDFNKWIGRTPTTFVARETGVR